MSFHIRSNISLYYRLFFVTLFLLSGIFCLGTVLLESYTELVLINTRSETDKNAIHSILTVMGILGITTAFIIIFLMHEKRKPGSDRRYMSKPTDFTDRRRNVDRRSA